jgi:hypothetical protein
MTGEAKAGLTERERELIQKVEKRFARHEGDQLMMALKEISIRYLLRRLKDEDG